MKGPQPAGLKFVYWFAYYNLSSPSVRYRGLYALQFLKKEYGINSCFVIPSYSPSGIFAFIKVFLSALIFRRAGSLIVIQRIHSGFIYSTLLNLLVRIRNENTFYDVDDADYLEHQPRSIYYFVRNCSAVFTGSEELLNNLSLLNKKILLSTSPVPDPLFFKKNKNPLLTIGWIGDFRGGHSESMKNIFFPALSTLPFKIKLILLGVTLKSEYEYLTNYFCSNKNVLLEMPGNIDWNNEGDIQRKIVTFDIGIATLLDTELQRSKSAFKAKQYLNNGIPVLSSDVPENNSFVEHGRNGFLCSTPDEFRQRIIEINNMGQEEYGKLSVEAMATIPRFNLTGYCCNIRKAFQETSESS